MSTLRSSAKITVFLAAVAAPGAAGQEVADTTLGQEGMYDRPFIVASPSASLGGYVEGNTNWFVQDGVREGFSMELRRFNVFFFSSISPRVRFLAELEFEHGTEEIALETALVDFQVRPAFSVRAGILLVPVGYVNQNHDSPRWDFVERPLVTTQVIPSTLSEMGVGAFGKVPMGQVILSYDAYLTNGLGERVVGGSEGRTSLAAGKGESLVAEDTNGSPAFSTRLAARRPGLGEVGLSYYGTIYNRFRVEGQDVDERRRIDLVALDLGADVGPVEARGELAVVSVDVPPGLAEVFGGRQWGVHLDMVLPLLRREAANYEDAALSAVVRGEHVDLNDGEFASTGRSIGDEITGVTAGLAFRPTPATVFRAGYRYEWIRDFVGNPRARRAGVQIGFATYF